MTLMRAPLDVLLVEDNRTDAELVREALTSWERPPHLVVFEDGEQAVAYLGSQPASNLPDLIFLDLNLPKKDGLEVLRELRADERLASIPVIVLTTSDREQDVIKAYGAHANCYLTKPLEFEAFIEKIKAIEHFWLMHARLPSRQRTNGSSRN
jgi:two-component system, chemotaxis family, response regulator Rcp1